MYSFSKDESASEARRDATAPRTLLDAALDDMRRFHQRFAMSKRTSAVAFLSLASLASGYFNARPAILPAPFAAVSTRTPAPIAMSAGNEEMWSDDDDHALQDFIKMKEASAAQCGRPERVLRNVDSAWVLIFNVGQADEGVYTLQGRATRQRLRAGVRADRRRAALRAAARGRGLRPRDAALLGHRAALRLLRCGRVRGLARAAGESATRERDAHRTAHARRRYPLAPLNSLSDRSLPLYCNRRAR